MQARRHLKMISHGGIVARIAVTACGLCIMLFPSTASAGRLLATGHDADHHCGRTTSEPFSHTQCHFFQVAVDYVRGGAPDPTKPVLVLDRGDLDIVSSIDRIYGPAFPRAVIEPRSEAFRTAPITTDLYSAVIIASSKGETDDPSPQDLNEFFSTPDSDAINARADDLRAFFNAGGGIYVNSGSKHGDEPGDPYYAFLPVTVRGAAVVSPFLLTDSGRALGFVEGDITCCPTHNTFEALSDLSALRQIDTDSQGRTVSIYAETPNFSALSEPPLSQSQILEVVSSLPVERKCISRRSIVLRLHRPKGVRFDRAVIYRNGKFNKRVRGKKVTQPIRIKVPQNRGATVKLRIVIFTTSKRKLTIRRTYKICV
jgi:hypothetical protein